MSRDRRLNDQSDPVYRIESYHFATHFEDPSRRIVRKLKKFAHCMRIVEAADKIVVLAEGCVAEEGSPAELRKGEHSMFRHMAELQAASAGWSV